MRTFFRSIDAVLLSACTAVLGVTVLYPVLRLAGSAAASWESGAVSFAPIANTVLLSLATVMTSGIVGTGLAFAVTRLSFPGKRLLSALALLPFTLPPLVGVLSFYYLIGRDGIATRIAGMALGMDDLELSGFAAILLIHTYSFFVFFYAMVSSALQSLDHAQLEAARVLGAGPLRTFTRVTIPLLMPALAGAALLTYMSSCASFSAPFFFGQDFPVLSTEVYEARSAFRNDAATTLTVVLAAVALLGLLVFRGPSRTGSGGTKGVPREVASPAGRRIAGAVATLGIVLLLLPHATIVWFAFVDHRAWHTELLPMPSTLDNFAELIRSRNAFTPIVNSVWASALAVVATLLVAVPAAYLVSRRRLGHRWLNVLVMLPWALPGTVIAINLIVAFNDPWLRLYNTIWLLPLAYFVRNVPIMARMAGAAIQTFDGTLIEAARTLGEPPARTLWRVAVPLLTPAIAAAAALIFATSLGEFVASILVYTPGNLPISVKINMEWRGYVGAAFAYSALLIALVAVTFVAARRFSVRAV